MYGTHRARHRGDALRRAVREGQGARAGVDDRRRDAAPTTCAGLCETLQGRSSSKRDRQAVPAGPDGAAPRRDRGGVQSAGTARARSRYRVRERIADDLGTAVNVQAMVFGNRDDNSGTGVGVHPQPRHRREQARTATSSSTRRARTSWPASATPKPSTRWPSTSRRSTSELLDILRQLEKHYRDMCDIEFTIEQGRLWMLQTRVGKRTGAAALRMAVEMTKDRHIDLQAARRCSASPATTSTRCCTRSFARRTSRSIAKGLAASPGAAVGQGVLHRRRRRRRRRARREGDPRAQRDVARRRARHDRGRGHPHVAGWSRQPRRRRRARMGHARGRRRRGVAASAASSFARRRRRRARGRRHLASTAPPARSSLGGCA